MAVTLAFAGKGGTGKTTLAAITVRLLGEAAARSVLAVDADPNSTLHEALGVEVERSVGEITEEMLISAGESTGMPKETWLEYNVQRYLVERQGYDLLSMGRPEGAGCYCYANNLVRGCIDKLARGYEYVVMDNEAGLEHLSRRTTRDVDVLLLVSDPSVRGIRTVARISALADELKIGVGARYLVINRGAEPLDPVLYAEAERTGLELAGVVPDDRAVTQADLDGSGVLAMPADATSLEAMRRVVSVVVPALRGAAL